MNGPVEYTLADIQAAKRMGFIAGNYAPTHLLLDDLIELAKRTYPLPAPTHEVQR